MKFYSVMGVVGRDQARRGQLVAKPVTQPMPDLDRESHREKDREMLARVKEFVGDDDKLLVEYQQDIDIDIGIESELPKLEFDQEFDQELSDCVEVPRRVSRRVVRCDENRYENRFERGFEFKCVFESRFEGRFEYGFECVFQRVCTQSENAVSELWEIS